MKTVYATFGLAVGASAAVLTPRQQCCFGLTASGGVSGSVGQLADGQNRVAQTAGLDNQNGQYCINNGQITDGNGRGCILTPPTTQFQCDTGATPSGGFSVDNGNLAQNGNTKFYSCPTGDNGGYNIYTTPVAGQDGCVEITLSTGGQCSGNGAASSSAAAASSASSVASASSEASVAASSSAASVASSEVSVTASSSVASASSEASVAASSSAASVASEASSAASVASSQATATVPTVTYEVSSAVASSPAPTAPACQTVYSTVYVTVNTCEASCASGDQGSASSVPGDNVPATSAPGDNASATSAPGDNASATSVPGDEVPATSAPGDDVPATSAPGDNASASSAQATSAPAASAPASSAAPSGTAPSSASGSACQTSLSGAYETPHAIIPVDSNSPDKSYGTQYNAYIGSGKNTIFNFDIPASYAGMQCTLIFLFPKQSELVTSSFTQSGSGGLVFEELSSPAGLDVTYNSVSKDKTQVGEVESAVPGNSYVLNTSACKAGATQSFEVSPTGDFDLEFFEDWNPSPIGVFLTAC